MTRLSSGERWIGLLPWCAALSLLGGAILATGRAPHMWFDEVCTLLTISDPSISHMIHAMADGAETSPPLYHLLARAWGQAFGFEQRPLRLFSTIGFMGALLVTYKALGRYYSRRAAAYGVVVAFAGSDLLIHYTTQLRFYGLFFCVASVALLAACLVMEAPVTWTRNRWIMTLAGLGVAISALLYTHVFGILYAGALSATILLHDLMARRRVRAGPAIAIAAGWMSFLPWLPAFRAQREVASSGLWILRPGPRTVMQLFDFDVRGLALFISVLVAAGVFARSGRRDAAPEYPVGGRLPIRLTALALFLVPLLTAAASYVTVPLFWPRYLLPSLLGLAILLAELGDGVGLTSRPEGLQATGWSRTSDLILGAGFALALTIPVFTGSRTDKTVRPDLALWAAVDTSLTRLPVVLESELDYVPMWYYSGRVPGRFVFVLDSASAVDAKAAPGLMAEIKLARAWKRAGYSPDIVDAEQYLASATRFIVVDYPERRFFERRIRDNPRWSHCRVGRYGQEAVQLVVPRGEALRGCIVD